MASSFFCSTLSVSRTRFSFNSSAALSSAGSNLPASELLELHVQVFELAAVGRIGIVGELEVRQFGEYLFDFAFALLNFDLALH